MNAITLVFPHQLFKENPLLTNENEKMDNQNKKRPVFLVEDQLYFGQYPFHKQKLLLHRASMHYYQEFLEKKGYEVSYLDYSNYGKLESVFEVFFKNHGNYLGSCKLGINLLFLLYESNFNQRCCFVERNGNFPSFTYFCS
jgi:deoxyribodipyrimidine photolyase-like uncharacterized protein